MVDKGAVRPFVDYPRRVFVTRSGVELHLGRVSSLILERLNADESGKPAIPKVEVKIAGKHTRLEENPTDPAYLDALRAWGQARNMRLVKYVFTHGIQNDTPKDFLDDHREYFPDASVSDLKYLWIGSLVDQDENDLKRLVEAITGQTEITEAGLNAAMDSFPGDNGGNADNAISVEAPADNDPL